MTNLKRITKQHFINHVLKNFSQFRKLLKKMHKSKIINNEIFKNASNRKYIENLSKKISDSQFKKILKLVQKRKKMIGGKIVTDIQKECKKNHDEFDDYIDPITMEPLQENNIVKDGDDPNSYCYNYNTIIENGNFRQYMDKNPYTKKEWTNDIRHSLMELGADFVTPLIPEGETKYPYGIDTSQYGLQYRYPLSTNGDGIDERSHRSYRQHLNRLQQQRENQGLSYVFNQMQNRFERLRMYLDTVTGDSSEVVIILLIVIFGIYYMDDVFAEIGGSKTRKNKKAKKRKSRFKKRKTKRKGRKTRRRKK
mgnify:CR=1 FL=1